jgi:hypothetical protein
MALPSVTVTVTFVWLPVPVGVPLIVPEAPSILNPPGNALDAQV